VRIEFCDELDLGFGWIVDEGLQRCSHALAVDGRVWVVDPVAWPPAEERIRALGDPAGVLQLLDRHERDCAALAERLGVPHQVVPTGGLPFEVVPVLRARFWREVALWWPGQRVLVCADALGTARYFRAGDEPLGVHPVLRLRPPRGLGRFEPEHVLGGHGAGLHENAAAAVREALRTARRRLPRAWLGALRARPAYATSRRRPERTS
jgi:glyoxylase-like metal-dependent hydrolase (beta-lactamase superfamily II)